MPVKWDDETEKKLLMAIIHVMGASAPTPNWSTVASLMGPDYTAKGIRQKFTKGLKKQAANQFREVPDGESGGSKTPVKRSGKKANGEKSVTGSKRKAKKAASEDDDEDDVEETPSNKVKAKKDDVSDEGDMV